MVNVAARLTFMTNGEYQSEDMHTPVLLQESKKLTHIKIIDEDYFDVDFSFEGMSTDPKAIYLKRKHFKDINPRALNPENVITTDLGQQQIKKALRQEPRYLSMLSSVPRPQALGYLLAGSSEGKLKLAGERLGQGGKAEGLYFKLLREDKLELFELYLALSREASLLEKSSDSQGGSSMLLVLAF